MTNKFDQLLNPSKVWSRAEILAKPSPAPEESGLYVWYFADVPDLVPTGDCIQFGDRFLLYCGICPRRSSPSGSQRKRRTLSKRLKDHFSGNASGSTLRLSLGCLLSEQLGIHLQVGEGSNRKTLGNGEDALSDWMDKNAFVTWMIDPEPWLLEDELIHLARPPLNLQGNRDHPFFTDLSAIRKRCKERAES